MVLSINKGVQKFGQLEPLQYLHTVVDTLLYLLENIDEGSECEIHPLGQVDYSYS